MKVNDFFQNEYLQFAFYSNFRSIAAYMDGFKPSSRKVIYTVDKMNITSPMKVARLAARVSEETEYLHGEGSLCGVIVNLAQNFIGSNNISLLEPEGTFGSRFIPEAAAPRYIYTRKSSSFDKLFNRDDRNTLISQEFEGTQIEYRYYIPIIPMILVNGSEGIGSGFAQKILPRNPDEIIAELKKKIENPSYKIKQLTPWYKGFKGKIRKNDKGSWEICGIVERVNTTNLKITEIPIGYDLQSYLKVLNKLVDDKIIKSFEDVSENDSFTFNLSVTREFTSSNNDEQLLEALKLINRVSENFTCFDENNTIIEFNSDAELFEKYVSLRLKHYDKRISFLLEKLSEEIGILESKIFFIRSVIDNKILVSNQRKADIETQLQKAYEDKRIIKVDNSFEYLLKMPIYSLTYEKIVELETQCKLKSEEKTRLNSMTNYEFWKEDLDKI